jgi:hypothetical protein
MGCSSKPDLPSTEEGDDDRVELTSEEMTALTERCLAEYADLGVEDAHNGCEAIARLTKTALEYWGCDLEAGIRSVNAQVADPLDGVEEFSDEACVLDGEGTE